MRMNPQQKPSSSDDYAALVQDALQQALARRQSLDIALRDMRRTRALDGVVDDEHDPEGETTSSMWSMLQGRLDDTKQDIEELTVAQQRLADSTYGICVTCGQPIGEGRLRRRPAATQCIDCARRSRLAR